MCHLLLLMPVIALPIFWVVPVEAASLIYATVLAVALWLYWFAWQAMRRPVETGKEELLHATARVLSVRGRSLQVRVHGEIWRAQSSDRIRPAEAVQVVGIDGLTLRVRRVKHDHANGVTSF